MSAARRTVNDASGLTSDALADLRALVGVVDSVLSAHAGELTVPQLRALVVLAASSPSRSVDLASALSLDPSTVSRLCARLKARRLITLRRSRASGREVEIELSARGRAVLDAVRLGGLAEVQRSFSNLDRLEPKSS